MRSTSAWASCSCCWKPWAREQQDGCRSSRRPAAPAGAHADARRRRGRHGARTGRHHDGDEPGGGPGAAGQGRAAARRARDGGGLRLRPLVARSARHAGRRGLAAADLRRRRCARELRRQRAAGTARRAGPERGPAPAVAGRRDPDRRRVRRGGPAVGAGADGRRTGAGAAAPCGVHHLHLLGHQAAALRACAEAAAFAGQRRRRSRGGAADHGQPGPDRQPLPGRVAAAGRMGACRSAPARRQAPLPHRGRGLSGQPGGGGFPAHRGRHGAVALAPGRQPRRAARARDAGLEHRRGPLRPRQLGEGKERPCTPHREPSRSPIC